MTTRELIRLLILTLILGGGLWSWYRGRRAEALMFLGQVLVLTGMGVLFPTSEAVLVILGVLGIGLMITGLFDKTRRP